jgi:hypothetical protein
MHSYPGYLYVPEESGAREECELEALALARRLLRLRGQMLGLQEAGPGGQARHEAHDAVRHMMHKVVSLLDE